MITLNFLFLTIISHIAPQYSKVNWAGTIFNNLFIFLGLETTNLVRQHIRQIQEISENKQKALEYQYDVLRAQVNPHFLFNTLNILYVLVDNDKNKSKQFILSLANIYRYILDFQGEKEVTLSNEVSFIQEYSQILMLRHNNNLIIEMNNPPETQHHLIPFTLQLLIENAVKHNKISSNTPMRITIHFTNNYLTVSNPINRKPTLSTSHKGLEYLHKLYAAYGKHIEIINNHETFIVKIPFIH